MVHSGEVLAFLDTGAYQDAGASNFNALPRPGTVLVTGGDAESDQAARDARGGLRSRHRSRAAGRSRRAGARPGWITSRSAASDLDRSLGFYCALLGMRLRGAVRPKGQGVRDCGLLRRAGPLGGHRAPARAGVGVDRIRGAARDAGTPADQRSGSHAHLDAGARTSLPFTLAWPRPGSRPKRNRSRSPIPAHGRGRRRSTRSDPDGVTVELIQPPPGWEGRRRGRGQGPRVATA